VALEIRVVLSIDRLDDQGASLGPDEVHVAWMNANAILIRVVEANARGDSK
jgi:hypothetical protein